MASVHRLTYGYPVRGYQEMFCPTGDFTTTQTLSFISGLTGHIRQTASSYTGLRESFKNCTQQTPTSFLRSLKMKPQDLVKKPILKTLISRSILIRLSARLIYSIQYTVYNIQIWLCMIALAGRSKPWLKKIRCRELTP